MKSSLKDRAPILFESLSWVTVALASAILISTFFLRQWMLFIRDSVGVTTFTLLVALLLMLCGSAFVFFEARQNTSTRKKVALASLTALGLVLAWQAPLPEEKLHFLEYTVLGWFAHRDFLRPNAKWKPLLLGFSFAAVVGILDEGIQEILPYRYFNWTDLVSNLCGAFLGSFLYFFHR